MTKIDFKHTDKTELHIKLTDCSKTVKYMKLLVNVVFMFHNVLAPPVLTRILCKAGKWMESWPEHKQSQSDAKIFSRHIFWRKNVL